MDKTRNLRRLVLLLDSDIVRVSLRTQGSDLRQRYDQTLGYDVSTILEGCRFRLHHFVYEGPDALSCLETFLGFQSMIRTLQVGNAIFDLGSHSHYPSLIDTVSTRHYAYCLHVTS